MQKLEEISETDLASCAQQPKNKGGLGMKKSKEKGGFGDGLNSRLKKLNEVPDESESNLVPASSVCINHNHDSSDDKTCTDTTSGNKNATSDPPPNSSSNNSNSLQNLWNVAVSSPKNGKIKAKLPNQKQLTKAKKTGNLLKKGDSYLSKKWKKRFVVLEGGELFWFRSKKDKRPTNSASIVDSEIQLHSNDKTQLTIRLNAKKTYVFKADTREVMEKWYEAIIENQNQQNTIQTATSLGASDSVANIQLDGMPKETNSTEERRKKILTEGASFLKINPYGIPQKRYIWFTNNLGRIVWGIEKKNGINKPKGYIMTHDILKLKNAKNMKRVSIIGMRSLELAVNHHKKKVLVLKTDNHKQADDWCDAIKWLLDGKERILSGQAYKG